jgi:hypothetical protein
VDLVVAPRTLVESGGRLRLHALYYITKQIIPALERVLSLVGADCRWAPASCAGAADCRVGAAAAPVQPAREPILSLCATASTRQG